ncbi:transcription antitermination factor NusB [Iamia sp.]|uniref:transcription antitermination factor NusB n=1 Tax=Iamia sp. TaxID=2722710 RepID=UPI002C605C91|nr:transcription antitermination factor NusB [Iamia sp.]HXH57879.1 transcription antitermination factor NusB [Iamia sp.]
MPDRPGGVGSRREARERALALLYEADTKARTGVEVLAAQPIEVEAYAADLVRGVSEHCAELDALLGRHARGWVVARMPVVDRNLLRMASYELLHRSDVPPNVVMNEAVELAQQYSTDDSGRFVNGVLAVIATEAGRTGG